MVVEFDRLVWGQPVRGIDWKNERCIEIPLSGSLAGFGKPGRVLDAGCALNVILPDEPVADVTHFTNTLAYEKQYPHPRRAYVAGDLRDLSRYPDGWFDRVLCVSTLEHVGMDNSNYGGVAEADPASSARAAAELWRVTKARLFLTVPFSLTEAMHGLGKFQYFTPDTLPTLTPAGAETAYYAKLGDGWAGPFREPRTDAVGAKVNQIAAVLACR
jgi:hypothetical protein